ncbi:MAG: Maf family protein [Bacteroidota bacterium]
MKLPPLILASRSPRRRLLLKQIGLSFTVRPSSAAERIHKHESPARNVRRVALEKARDVSRTVRKGIIIGADTVVVIDGSILGKPRTRKEARKMLRKLSGRVHTVYTAFVLVEAGSGRRSGEVVKTRVRFNKLSREEIAQYVKSGSPLDKAGAYGIQDDFGAVFVDRIEGDFYNVVGFPLARFYRRLQDFIKNQKSTAKGSSSW